jgi:hypothetical protein
MRQNQFNQDMTNMLTALTNQGSILSGQSAPLNALFGAGAKRQGQEQAQLTADQRQFEENRDINFNRDQELLRILMGAPASAPQIPNQTNPLLAGLGTVTTLDQLGVFGGGQPPATNPVQPTSFNPSGSGTGGTFNLVPNQTGRVGGF